MPSSTCPKRHDGTHTKEREDTTLKTSRTNWNRLNKLTKVAFFSGPPAAVVLFAIALTFSNGWFILAALAALIISPTTAALLAIAASRMGSRISTNMYLYRLERGL